MTTSSGERLVLDYPSGKWRLYQPSPLCLPELQREWVAHTEPDGLSGKVWLAAHSARESAP